MWGQVEPGDTRWDSRDDCRLTVPCKTRGVVSPSTAPSHPPP